MSWRYFNDSDELTQEHQKVVKTLLNIVETSKLPEARAQSIYSLSELAEGGHGNYQLTLKHWPSKLCVETAHVLVEALADESIPLEERSISCLINLQAEIAAAAGQDHEELNSLAIETYASVLLNEKACSHHRDALYALRNFGLKASQAAPQVTRFYFAETSGHNDRSLAEECLVKFGSTAAYPEVIKNLEQHPFVVVSLLKTLEWGRISDLDRYVAAIPQSIDNDSDKNLRDRAYRLIALSAKESSVREERQKVADFFCKDLAKPEMLGLTFDCLEILGESYFDLCYPKIVEALPNYEIAPRAENDWNSHFNQFVGYFHRVGVVQRSDFRNIATSEQQAVRLIAIRSIALAKSDAVAHISFLFDLRSDSDSIVAVEARRAIISLSTNFRSYMSRDNVPVFEALVSEYEARKELPPAEMIGPFTSVATNSWVEPKIKSRAKLALSWFAK